MLNPIRIVFQRIHDSVDKAKYIEDRLELLLKASESDEPGHQNSEQIQRISADHRQALIQLVVNSRFAEPELADTQQHPALTANQELIASERIQCAFNTISALNPLLPGEHLIEQQQSYLSEAWLGYAPRTGVIKQITDMATLYFVFLDCFIESSGDVQWVPPRDRQQKVLFTQAIRGLPSDCDERKLLTEKLSKGLRLLVPVPYNSLAVSSYGNE